MKIKSMLAKQNYQTKGKTVGNSSIAWSMGLVWSA